MPAFLPAFVPAVVPSLIGLAQVFCQVSADDSSRPGATIQAALTGNGQTAELTYEFRGQSTILETAAPVSFGKEGDLLITSPFEDIDWSSDLNAGQCATTTFSTRLELQEVQFGSYEGTFQRSARLHFNPFWKQPCSPPFAMQMPVSTVTCVAAIR